MAKLSTLIPALAVVLGEDEATVGVTARFVREAGLIVSKGRGPGAADMGPADCANLLIGMLCARSVKNAATIIPYYRDLMRKSAVSSTFGAEVENLIERARSGNLQNERRKLVDESLPHVPQDERDSMVPEMLQVAIYRPFPYAEISRLKSWSPKTYEVTEAFQIDTNWPFSPQWKTVAGTFRGGDKRERVTVTERTIFALGELLRT